MTQKSAGWKKTWEAIRLLLSYVSALVFLYVIAIKPIINESFSNLIVSFIVTAGFNIIIWFPVLDNKIRSLITYDGKPLKIDPMSEKEFKSERIILIGLITGSLMVVFAIIYLLFRALGDVFKAYYEQNLFTALAIFTTVSFAYALMFLAWFVKWNSIRIKLGLSTQFRKRFIITLMMVIMILMVGIFYVEFRYRLPTSIDIPLSDTHGNAFGSIECGNGLHVLIGVLDCKLSSKEYNITAGRVFYYLQDGTGLTRMLVDGQIKTVKNTAYLKFFLSISNSTHDVSVSGSNHIHLTTYEEYINRRDEMTRVVFSLFIIVIVTVPIAISQFTKLFLGEN